MIARLARDALPLDVSHRYKHRNPRSTPLANPTSTIAMDAPELEERPHKKRRFFTEPSSSIESQPSSHDSPLQSRSASPSVKEGPDEGENTNQVESMEGFDVDLLQAVVGELSTSVLQTLKNLSANDVQRGTTSGSHCDLY